MKYISSLFILSISFLLLSCVGNSNFVSNIDDDGTQALKSSFALQDNLLQESTIFLKGETIRFYLSLTNHSSEDIILEFDSGQQYDFHINNSLDSEVWRWSSNMLFTQALSEITISVGETLEFRESWDQTLVDGTLLPTGDYEAYGNTLGQDELSFKLTIQ